jgi:hypothetical protein
MRTPSFTHRPVAGVSVGAYSTGTQLIVAFAIANNGVSRNGHFNPERSDKFSRRKARQILNGRFAAVLEGRDVPMTLTFDTTLSSQKFIAAFREVFKPDPTEQDSVLGVWDHVAVFSRKQMVAAFFRSEVSDIIEFLTNLSTEVVAHAGASV